eukprot:883553-Amorphochlora_amoeboformis.AAC.1
MGTPLGRMTPSLLIRISPPTSRAEKEFPRLHLPQTPARMFFPPILAAIPPPTFAVRRGRRRFAQRQIAMTAEKINLFISGDYKRFSSSLNTQELSFPGALGGGGRIVSSRCASLAPGGWEGFDAEGRARVGGQGGDEMEGGVPRGGGERVVEYYAM